MARNLRLLEPPPDRRSHPRRTTFMRGKLHHGPDEIDCVIESLSAGGAGVIARKPLAEGDIVTLRIDQYGIFPGRIAWRRDNRLGVKFLDAPADVARALGFVDA